MGHPGSLSFVTGLSTFREGRPSRRRGMHIMGMRMSHVSSQRLAAHLSPVDDGCNNRSGQRFRMTRTFC